MTTSKVRDAKLEFATFEWPTWLLLVITYSAWISITLNWSAVPGWLLWFLGGYTVALHSSLQHEALHGHPTGNPRLNLMLVWPPLTLWLPLEFYVRNHLLHHRSELTNPELDPESFYLGQEKWQGLSRWQQRIFLFNNSFSGRMLIGPWLAAGRFYHDELAKLRRGKFEDAGILLRHGLSLAALLYWLLAICEMPFYLYLLTFAWPGSSMMMIRSFLEHRYDPDETHRTVLVDGCPLTRLLFLNNNYHWIHHRHPEMAWYHIPAAARELRQLALASNGNYRYSGYWSIAWRYLLKPWTHPAYPP